MAVALSAQLLLATACKDASAQESPTITFVTPAAGATYASRATIPIQVNVTDPAGEIAKVEFRANELYGSGVRFPGALIGSDSSAPYTFTWTNVTGGTHKISAIGRDASGRLVTSNSLSVVVTGNPNIRPTVRVLEPVQNSVAVANSPVTFKVEASDADGSIDCVLFSELSFLGASQIGQDCSPPYQFTWAPGNGTYEVMVNAVDNVGQASGQAVEFAIGNHRPTVRITSPVNGALFSPGQQFVVRADASDSDGFIRKVEFWSQARGTLYGTDTTAPYETTLTMPANGGIGVMAIAYDNNGATRETSVIGFSSLPPITIALTSPYEGASFAAQSSMPIAAAVSDPGNRVQRVDFTARSAGQTIAIGSDSSPPYSINWNAVPAGSYGINATAFTDMGTIGALQVNVNVIAQNQPPTIAMTTPSDGAVYTEPASVALAVTASDSDGSIVKVEFYTDGALLATDTSAPFGVQWDGIKASIDPFRLHAVAYDNQGASTATPVRTITVNPAPQPPQVALQAPVSGGTFLAPAQIVLKAAAADADGTIARVEFYAGTQLLGSDTASPYEFTWQNVAVGNYSLTAKAFDNSGLSTTSVAAAVAVITAPAEVLHFYHSDAQGSVVAVSDAAGQRVTSTNYRPFGQIADGTGTNSPTRLGYTGKLRDTDLALNYFGARFYDPVYGRFVGLDPVDFDPANLQSFGRYAYANNNPYRFVDPDGRQSRDLEWEYRISGADRSRQDGINLFAWMAVETLCGFCDLNYYDPTGSGALQPVGAPWEIFTPSRGMVGSLASREVANFFASNFSRVGRWMSRAEYQAMKTTRVVQADSAGMHRVAYPATPEAYKAAPKGDIYVEYDVPTSSLSPGGTEAWRTIYGPGSPAARLAEKKGLPTPQLPTFQNLSEPLLIK